MKERVLEVEIGSPPDYEELVAYVSANDRSIGEVLQYNSDNPSNNESRTEIICGSEIALIHKEEGPDKVKVKFLEGIQDQEYAFDDLIQALEKAKEALLR